jgi:hypothetical protein
VDTRRREPYRANGELIVTGLKCIIANSVETRLPKAAMFFREYQPHSDLVDYVQVIWTIESEDQTDHYAREQILPDGIVEVVFHYRDPFVTYESDGTSNVQPASFAISQMIKFIEIESNGSIGLIAVRFFPWGVYHFSDTPIKNFLDGFVSNAVLWNKTYHQIVEQLGEETNHQDRFRYVEQYLLARLKDHKRDDNVVDAAIDVPCHVSIIPFNG